MPPESAPCEARSHRIKVKPPWFVPRTRCTAKWCTADPGPYQREFGTVPGLQRTTGVLRCARDTRSSTRHWIPAFAGMSGACGMA